MTDGADQTEEGDLLPAIRAKVALKGAATAYVCENQTCDLPTTDPDVFSQQIRKVRVIR